MTSTIYKTPRSSNNKQSLFFNDLATPVSTRRTGSNKFTTTPGQSAAVSALWRENFATSDLPPPPVFTLEDRSDFSPEPDFPIGSPSQPDPIRTPTRSPSSSNKMFSSSPSKNNSSTSGWWSEKGKGVGEGSGSPVDGVVNREKVVGELITLPRPREVARPEVKRSGMGSGGGMGMVDEEEWVTVYGFSPADTNLVLREFEKCGLVLKHITGPRNSNWMHILYQSRFDAQKALSKNGMQLNGALIIGVKPVDPMQRQSLSDRLHNQGFMPIPPQTSTRKSDAVAFNASARAYQQNGNTNTSQSGGTMASPAKSVVSKIVDLMFGL